MSESQDGDRLATAIPQEIDGDSDQMKAFRAWMLKVNIYLRNEGIITADERMELRDLTFQATGWGSVVEDDDD